MSFLDSSEAAIRRAVREAIRNSKLTKSEQGVTLALANLWFHHRNITEAVIRPGRERLARKARVSVRTVASTLAKLRAAGVLSAVKYANGGRNATRYQMRLVPLLSFCGVDLPTVGAGELTEIARFSIPVLHGCPAQEFHTDLSTVAKRSSRTSKTQVAASLRVVGGRDV
jgi:hypothetical protein